MFFIYYIQSIGSIRRAGGGYTPGSDVVADNGFWTKINEKYEVPALKLHGEGIETVVRRRARGLVFDLDAPGLNRELVPYYRITHDHYNLYWVVS
jgi:hypothetical protein